MRPYLSYLVLVVVPFVYFCNCKFWGGLLPALSYVLRLRHDKCLVLPAVSSKTANTKPDRFRRFDFLVTNRRVNASGGKQIPKTVKESNCHAKPKPKVGRRHGLPGAVSSLVCTLRNYASSNSGIQCNCSIAFKPPPSAAYSAQIYIPDSTTKVSEKRYNAHR